ncbi:hypothetical protein FB446DRAFT_732250 [Lentinula raphanica]|nr:hypothetical protein FB446DRAFT_732250 [Lentinula raphanica]
MMGIPIDPRQQPQTAPLGNPLTQPLTAVPPGGLPVPPLPTDLPTGHRPPSHSVKAQPAVPGTQSSLTAKDGKDTKSSTPHTITVIPATPEVDAHAQKTRSAGDKSLDKSVSRPPPNTTAETWDGWIDGNIEADFSWDDIEKTHDLMVHWARRDYGSRGSHGNSLAEEWILGKKNTRCCLGVIVCDDTECKTIIRPQTAAGGGFSASY